LQIAIDVIGPTARQFTVTTHGDRFAQTIDELQGHFGPRKET